MYPSVYIMLNIAMFNTINSYSNKKDTLWKNINYLKYFYHLFPTHVNKFYSVFQRYVNPKIEQLKSSIQSLECEKSSIDCQIKYLIDTKGLIEKFSGQITCNVTELNNKISSHDEFNPLIETIKNQLKKSISELKALDKTTDIDTTLCKMVEQIKKEDEEMLQWIKEELKKHEEDVKKKLDGYIGITKNGLSTIKEKISRLEEKILSYIKVGGEFQKLGTQLRSYYNNVDYVYISRNKYLKKVGSFQPIQYNDVKQKLMQVNKHRNEYGKNIWNVKKELIELYRRLCCVGSARHVIDDFERHKGDYTQILPQIPDFVNRLEPFENFGDKIMRGAGPMKELIEITTSIELAKSIVDQKKNDLDPILPNNLGHIHVIKTQDLYRLISDISDLRSSISTSIKRLNNTKLLIEYLNAFVEQKKIFDKIQIDGSRLRVIGKLISSMKKFRKGYDELTRSVSQYSHKLFGGFERRNQRTKNHRKNRREYLPTTMPLGRKPLKEITGQIKKLRAIQSFSPSLNGYSIGSLHLIQGPEGADVDGLLDELEIIDEVIAGSGHIGLYVGKISESYDQNKGQINDTTPGNSAKIKELVDKINEIPNKIGELHSKVRNNIVLLNIAKSVNGTLKKVGEKTGELGKIGGIIKVINRYIGFVNERYQYISEIIGHLGCFKGCIRLVCIKGNVEYLMLMIDRIREYLGFIEWSTQQISKRITKLQEYQKILGEIYGEIKNRTLQLMGFPLGTLYNGSTSGGQSACGEETVISSLKGVIKHLRGIENNIMEFMKCISDAECYIDNTKRKLGCFVSSFESKVKEVNDNIQNVELSIESVIICFLKCSNKFITKNTIKSTKRMLNSGGQLYNNELAKPSLRCLENIG